MLSQGLAYSVSGGWDTPLDHPGLFAAGGNTAAPAQFLEQLQRVLQVGGWRHQAQHLCLRLIYLSCTIPGRGLTDAILQYLKIHPRMSLRGSLGLERSCPRVQEATEVAPTEREVALAKSEMLNSFVFNFASTNTQMQRVAAYALLGIPEVGL